jgi:DNA topoisomerase-1
VTALWQTDPILAAEAARLHHVDDRGPGLHRRPTGRTARVGKRFVPTFVIVDPAGARVQDESTLGRIRALAIPPAWTDVWICPRADGHIQATGRDARGRKQYRYHPRWREERDGTKYARMIEFGRALPTLRRQIAVDVARPGLPRRKVLAAVVKLLETTFIRVGNEEYARTNRSFGLTTLEDRHVDFRGGAMRFHFRGKSGVFHEVAVQDPRLARIVRQCRDIPGQELFQYRDEAGNAQSIDSADVNAYIREAAGEEFTAKDFRTWAGTVLAAVALDAIAVETVARMKAAPARKVARRAAADVARAIQQVAERLGNTPAVCRKCYVHPAVIGAYLEGASIFPSGPRASLPKTKRAVDGGGGASLRPDETAVLALLKRRLADEKAGRSTSLSAALFRSVKAGRRAKRFSARATTKKRTEGSFKSPANGRRRAQPVAAHAITGVLRATA